MLNLISRIGKSIEIESNLVWLRVEGMRNIGE
jgi:hypothetical protein